jgi:hypothetical protein
MVSIIEITIKQFHHNIIHISTVAFNALARVVAFSLAHGPLRSDASDQSTVAEHFVANRRTCMCSLSKDHIHCPVQRVSSSTSPLIARRYRVTVAFMDSVNAVQPSVLLESVPSMTGMQSPKHGEHITVYIPTWQLSIGNLVPIIKPLHLAQKAMRRAATSSTPAINPSKCVVGLPRLLKIPFKGIGLPRKAWLPQKVSRAHPVTVHPPLGPGLSTVCPPTSVSLDHSLCYATIHFVCSFDVPRRLIWNMGRISICLSLYVDAF